MSKPIDTARLQEYTDSLLIQEVSEERRENSLKLHELRRTIHAALVPYFVRFMKEHGLTDPWKGKRTYAVVEGIRYSMIYIGIESDYEPGVYIRIRKVGMSRTAQLIPSDDYLDGQTIYKAIRSVRG